MKPVCFKQKIYRMNQLKMALVLLLFGLLWNSSCSDTETEEISESFLRKHITWLADEEYGE